VRTASLDDVSAVLDLLAAAAEWSAARGQPNWPARFPTRLISEAADADAGYVHRLAVVRAHAGRGLGSRLLDWADEQVWARDRTWLRIDVVTDYRRLRRYYESAGFLHRRDVAGEFVMRDGTRRPWTTSLYERSSIRKTG
jgi:GNAT superfamily N-acetyltransferase